MENNKIHEKGALLRRRRGSALEWAREKKEAGREGMKKNRVYTNAIMSPITLNVSFKN